MLKALAASGVGFVHMVEGVTGGARTVEGFDFAALRKLKIANPGETSDQDFRQYLFDPTGIQNGTAFRLFGLPVIITDNIPNASTKARVALVDFSKVVVARDVDATVKILDQTWGDYDSIGIRVVSRWDTALLQAKAVTLLTEA